MKFGVISARRAGTAIVLAALLVALTLLLQFTGAYAVFTGGTVRKLPVYSVEREDKKIAITFDCAWGTEHTDAILKALEAENVRATFFMVQFWTEKYPSTSKRSTRRGMRSARTAPRIRRCPNFPKARYERNCRPLRRRSSR